MPEGARTPLLTRLATARPAIRLAAFAAVGALMSLGQVPVDRPAALVLGIAMAMSMFPEIRRIRAAFWSGWALGAAYFALSLSWIVEPFFVDAARHGWMAPFALAFMAGGLALFWGAAFALARWRGGGPLRDALALAVVWSAAEAARAHVLTGFPWNSVAQAALDTPAAPLLALVGPQGTTFMLLLAIALFVWIADRVTTLAYPVGVIALIALAALTWQPAAPPPREDAPLVRIIQPNAPQTEKWDPARAPVFFERARSFTALGDAPDLVVWPETSIPEWLNRADPWLDLVSEASRGAPAIVGIQRYDGLRFYNSLVVLGRGGQVRSLYDKAHLVPFGEYVPLGGLMARFGIHGLAANEGGGYSAGQGGTLIDLPGIGAATPLICYEGIFAEELHRTDPRPRLMVLITNDAWFGTRSGPYQHLAQARMRAIEQGLPMVRAANTGVSAMIDARGRVTHSLPLGQAGAIDAPLPPALPPTLYARMGELPVLLWLALATAALIFWRPPLRD